MSSRKLKCTFLSCLKNKYRSPIIAAEVRRPAKALQKLKLGRITNLLAQWLHRLRVGSGLKRDSAVNDQQINQLRKLSSVLREKVIKIKKNV